MNHPSLEAFKNGLGKNGFFVCLFVCLFVCFGTNISCETRRIFPTRDAIIL